MHGARFRSMMPQEEEARRRNRGVWPSRTILDDLGAAAAARPRHPAVIDPRPDGGRTLSYGELATLVERVAQGLASLGVREGEPVGFQLPNWWEFVVLQLAIARLGAVSMPLMPMFRERELRFMLGRTGCRIVAIPDRFRGTDHLELLQAVRPHLPALEHVVVVGSRAPAGTVSFAQLLASDAHPLPPPPVPSQITQLLYTSGTSGEPKGVLHTHETLLSALHAHVAHFGLTSADTVYVPSPTAHQTGFLYGMWLALHLGATAVYQDIWEPRRALSLLRDTGARFVQAATPFLADLVEAVSAGEAPPGSLRLFVATGAPVPRVLANRARDVLGAAVCGGWGTTESGLVTAGTPADPPERTWQTDGRTLPGMGVRIVDDAGRDLPPGTEGRLLVDTPAMFVGYVDHPDWYRNAFPEGMWFDTGDLATMDPDGFVRITGRAKDVINRGGEKVPVVEVEELLYRHPGVAEVAVVGMPDPRLGERACAYVVPRPGYTLTLAGLTAHLQAAGMAKYYWPERLELVDSLPRTPSGKIQKYILRQWIRDKLAQEAAHSSHVEKGGSRAERTADA